ncbi:NUDIX hydrolase [Nocardia rhizosphaerihabitans]|uniref:Nudix hydrolase domain-containing protein n=1 Tax=Nocardia rhizosphaerihabitans TaxID=1691570 RepID=A0ABQ2L4P3_9NOCA|nr:NUDIX domain-containing protein [Nocardia rhizosphaerihabitans]GGO00843.1 hypothetical protein GCM10011610_70180 [Nocardia rhizosphaerihabitans]
MLEPRIRVAGYVVRDREVPELLVFDHVGMPEAGTQIPAGGVRQGEELESAVLREIAEETGLVGVSVVEPMGVDRRPHPGTQQPRWTTYFHLRAPADSADAWVHRVVSDDEDSGLVFACRFVPLPLDIALVDHQDAWLNRIVLPEGFRS